MIGLLYLDDDTKVKRFVHQYPDNMFGNVPWDKVKEDLEYPANDEVTLGTMEYARCGGFKSCTEDDDIF